MSPALQATVAEKHGRRVVLVLSLLGSSVTCFIFGTSTTLQQAIVIRLAQGVFAGAVGVARGSVAFVTDATNEGRAYAILGFVFALVFFKPKCVHLTFILGFVGV
jgi:MFS family permease